MGDYFETCFWDVDIDSPLARNQYTLFKKLDEFDIFLPCIVVDEERGKSFLQIFSYLEEDNEEEMDKLFTRIMELASECGDVGEVECAYGFATKEQISNTYHFSGRPLMLREGRRDNKQEFDI